MTRRSLAHTADQIRKAGGNIIGAVMNSVSAEEGYGYYYQYYYYQYADQPTEARDSRAEQRWPAEKTEEVS